MILILLGNGDNGEINIRKKFLASVFQLVEKDNVSCMLFIYPLLLCLGMGEMKQ